MNTPQVYLYIVPIRNKIGIMKLTLKGGKGAVNLIITIHQPEHLPWLGYFHKMSLADKMVILDNVDFRKNYFQNRNKIMTAGGPTFVTVPVSPRQSSSKLIKDIVIQDGIFKKKYMKTIYYSYKNHPFFLSYYEPLEQIIAQDWSKLIDLNMALIEFIRKQLGVTTELIKASELGVTGEKTELLLNICSHVGASAYLSGPTGREYLDGELFSAANIEVVFHEFAHPVYPQLHVSRFVSHLSCLDLLFNCGHESRRFLFGDS